MLRSTIVCVPVSAPLKTASVGEGDFGGGSISCPKEGQGTGTDAFISPTPPKWGGVRKCIYFKSKKNSKLGPCDRGLWVTHLFPVSLH